MKSVIMTMVLVLASMASAIGQYRVSVSSDWTTSFSFGGMWDQPSLITTTKDNGFIYVSGNVQVPNGSPNIYAVITKMTVLGEKVWQVSGDTLSTGRTFSYDGIASTADGGVLWVIDPSDPNQTGFAGVIKLDANGNEQWRFPCKYPAVQTSGDTTFVVCPNVTTGLVYVLDKNGQVLQQYTLQFAVVRPTFTVLGNYIYLFSEDWVPGPYLTSSAYAAKVDWRTGQKIWSVEFLNALIIKGQADDSGNAYVAASRMDTSDSASYPTLMNFTMAKINDAGQVDWQYDWHPRKTVLANEINGVYGCALDAQKKEFVLYGVTQRGEGQNDGWSNYYAYARNTETGDSLWCLDSVYSYRAKVNQFRGGVFIGGALILMGNTFTGPNAPNVSYLTLYNLVTPVNEPQPPLPQAFALSQNYPNPFNPTTTISYDLPQRTNVTLTVYNVLGQVVETLVNEEQVGKRQVVFDGSRFASGTYLYVLQADGNRLVQKMMLVK